MPTTETAATSAIEQARERLQDPEARRRALFMAWYLVVGSAVGARELSEDDRVPVEDSDEAYEGTDAQVRVLLPHLPKDEPEPEPVRVVAPSAPVSSSPSATPLAPAPAPAVESSRPGKASWFDKVPKAVTRDRRLPAPAVLLYLLMLDASQNDTKVTRTSQATLARFMGHQGRGQVRAYQALLAACGYIERVYPASGRDWQTGWARQWRVRVGDIPLAPEHDRRGKGLA